jgi:hypothetical protein
LFGHAVRRRVRSREMIQRARREGSPDLEMEATCPAPEKNLRLVEQRSHESGLGAGRQGEIKR